MTGSRDGVGVSAQFFNPYGITSDGTNLYVADKNNHTIRQVAISTGVVTTIAGSGGLRGTTDGIGSSARFASPFGITIDGNILYVTDSGNQTIRKVVIATGEVTTVAGSAGSSGSTDGSGTSARFNGPTAITTDGPNLYVADTNNHTIRQVVIATGTVTTIAGSSGLRGTTDGTGSAARFASPFGITTDRTNLYVADSFNNTIRKVVITTGVVSTFAGSAGSWGMVDGNGSMARFASPLGITTDGTNLYVSDTGNFSIRKIEIATGDVTTIAGSAGLRGLTDGTGAQARFYMPIGLTTDGTSIYLVDNSTIRKVVITSGVVTTVAGSAGSSGSTDGIGASVRFSEPSGITTDGTYVYILDYNNHTIRRMVIATGEVTTIAGSVGSRGSTDGTGTAARFDFPSSITTDASNLYVVDNSTIRKVVITSGEVTTIAGSAGSPGYTDGTGTSARFDFSYGIRTTGITADRANLYVTDTGNHTIRKIVIATGEVTTIAGSAGLFGSTDGVGAVARFKGPNAITTDGINLYVGDTGNHTIRKVVITTGEVTTIAGSAGLYGSTDGTGTAARFNTPTAITTDGTCLYVADTNNHIIRKLLMATGEVTTIVGSAGLMGSIDGIGSGARITFPSGITIDGIKIYITDSSNNTLRIVQ